MDKNKDKRAEIDKDELEKFLKKKELQNDILKKLIKEINNKEDKKSHK